MTTGELANIQLPTLDGLTQYYSSFTNGGAIQRAFDDSVSSLSAMCGVEVEWFGEPDRGIRMQLTHLSSGYSTSYRLPATQLDDSQTLAQHAARLEHFLIQAIQAFPNLPPDQYPFDVCGVDGCVEPSVGPCITHRDGCEAQ